MKNEFVVTRTGFFEESHSKGQKPIEKFEIELCEQFIKECTSPSKTYNKIYGSYNFKHEVERYFGIYIPNGAFIQAAINLGVVYRREGKGPNAEFKLKYAGGSK